MHENESLPGVGWEQQLIESCFERAKYLEELIGRAQDKETASKLYAEIMPGIEKDFPYYGQPVYMSGLGLHPVFDDDGSSVIAETWQLSEGDNGIHLGFAIIHSEDNEIKPFHIMHKVLVGEGRGVPYATVEMNAKVYKYFELDSQLLPVIEVEAALSSYEFSDIEPQDKFSIINTSSKEFVDMLRSTKFRRLQHKRQQRVVDDFLLHVENKAGVRDLQFIGEPLHAYIPSLVGNKRLFNPLNLEDALVVGTCLGLDTVETGILNRKAIRRDSDLGDKWCGLCLVVDPDDDTRNFLQLNDGQVVYIPTYDQTFDAQLYEESN